MKNNIIVVIPTYEERTNISPLLNNIFSPPKNISVLVIDDNSPDGTSEEVVRLQTQYPNLFLITRRRRLGLGSAYRDGFRYALEKGYEIIFQMDADLSHPPVYIPAMVGLLKDYDLVIGSRYIRGGRISNWPASRLFLSRSANIFARSLLHLPIEDLTSGFKCMKRSVLEKIDFPSVKSKGYAFLIEVSYRAFLKGFKIAEYPIIFQGRKNERSKMSLKIVIEAFFKVVSLWLKRIIVRYKRWFQW